MIRVARAPAFATIQDPGRHGLRANGVPRSGAMDTSTVLTLNAMLGNAPEAAAIEWAVSGGELVFESSASFALGGATAEAKLNGRGIEPWLVIHASSGDTLEVQRLMDGRFLYVAFAGGMDVPVVMGSRSTCLPASFGGMEGRRLATGDLIPLGRPRAIHRATSPRPLPEGLRPPAGNGTIRFIPRGDLRVAGGWRVSPASDRTGYRLEAPDPTPGASITSSPVCPGAIQLPPSGEPIVLMADAPTVGGYAIAGAVITADLGVLAQRSVGGDVVLEPCSVEAGAAELKGTEARLARVREWHLR